MESHTHQLSLSVDPLTGMVTSTTHLQNSSDSLHTHSQTLFKQTNLVTDNQNNLTSSGFTRAKFEDPNLVNPWGLSLGSTGAFWVADNGTGVATLYDRRGVKQPLTVTIPPPSNSSAGTVSAPTGQVHNSTSNFVISSNGKSAPSQFIFATEDGTISGWNPTVNQTNAVLGLEHPGAIYKGLALGQSRSGNFLYAADFHNGKIDVINSKFQLVDSVADPHAPAGFAPFNIQNLGGKLYVTFAKQDAIQKDDVAGARNGFIDVFNPNRDTFKRFASGTAAGGTLRSLDSPWGMALTSAGDAHHSWVGNFNDQLLVGNFGNGVIDRFNTKTGDFLGKLKNVQGKPIQIDRLWALGFGNDRPTSKSNALFFTAGIGDEQHGLFGKLEPKTTAGHYHL